MDEIRTQKALKEHAGLEAEFLQEIAEALGNAGERLDRAIAQVTDATYRIEELKRELAHAAGPKERDEIRDRLRTGIVRHNHLREKALEQYRWFLIHREAVGLRNHRMVAEQYAIPPAIKLPGESGVRIQKSE
jgi:hypothetical protein